MINAKRAPTIKAVVIPAILALCLLAPLQLSGQTGSGLLAPNRFIDWSNAGAGSIPARTTVCASLTSSATPSAVQSALSSCPSGQTVSLAAGTYNWSSSLIAHASNVTLRGAGPNSTILKFTATTSNCLGIGGGVPICAGNANTSQALQYSSDVCTITAGTAQGSTSITLGTSVSSSIAPFTSCTPSDLHVGSLMQLTQVDNSPDNGNWWRCGTGPTPPTATCTWGGASNGWVPNYGTAGNPGRSLDQTVTVTGVSGSVITFTPALYAPVWSQGSTPYADFVPNLPLTGFGIENLTIDTTSLGDNESMVEFIWTTNSWIKNVRMVNPNVNFGAGTSRKHVFTAASNHLTIRDSYLYGSAGSSDGYGVDFAWGTSDSLAENNICQHLSTCMITENGAGNVFGYNYAVDNYYANGGGAWQQGDVFHHDSGDHYNLVEGHEGIQWANDDFHGTSFGETVFRSRFSGFDPANTCAGGASCGTTAKSANTIAMVDMAFARYENDFLNVLGTSGTTTQYANTGPSALSGGVLSNCPATTLPAIYSTNYSDQNQLAWSVQGGIGGNPCFPSSFNLDNDVLTSASLARWGNYDTVNAAVRTNSGETASGASTYPGLATPSTSYGSYKSLYLASQPSWWGSMPWPAIGPDVTGGDISGVGGHAYHNPAANCYLTIMGGSVTGSSAALPFDATTCYSAVGPTPVSSPTFSPSPSSYAAAQTITLSSSTSGATICYTTDGSTPTANGAGTCVHGSIYSVPFTLSSTTTVKAIGSKSGFTDSTVASGLFTINGSAAAPTFSPGAGSYGGTQTVTISSTTAGSTLCFTSDGSTPTADGNGTCTHGTTYSTPVSVSTSQTLKAIASKATFLDSSVSSAAYVINGTASTPTFSPVAGSYGPTQNVTISSSTSGSTICYTTNGSSPTSSSPGVCAAGSTQYASPVAVASSLTIKAIATKAGFTDSSIGSAAYVINGAVATPTFSPVGGAYGAAQTVTIATVTGSAVLCYTTDGSTPTASGGTCTHGTTYSAPITVSTSQTVQAIGTKAGFSESAVANAVYTINGTLPTPTFAPAAGGYATTQTVTISAASGSPVVMVNAMQETANANDTIGSTVHRNTYTNCATGFSGGVLQPAGQPVGTLYCTSADKTAAVAAGGPNNGVVTSTISGTGTSALDNGNGAGGSDSPPSVTATYAGATGSDCGAHGSSASSYISGLTFPDPGANAQLVMGITTGSPGNSSILTVSKYNSSGDLGRYVAQRDCVLPNSITVGGAHYESDYNYNTTGGTYMGFGKDYDMPNKHFRAGPQGSSWIVEELCPVGGGACFSTYTLPASDALSIESYEHWDAGCTFSSSTACAHYDALCLQQFNAGSPVASQQCYNIRNASTHGTIDFIPINKTSWTHPQYAIQHQWDIIQSSATLTANVDYSTALAYYTTSGIATICYTIDGTTPTGDGAGNCTHGTAYTVPITVSSTTTVKAIATQAGSTDSGVGSATYTINGTAATPTFSPVAGTYSSTQSVTLSSSTAGATICYTTDGSIPTADGAGTCTHGTTYSTAVSVAASLTIQAIASKAAFTDSGVGSAAYIITSITAPQIEGKVAISGRVTIP